MVATLIRIHDVNRLVATLEAVLNERKQHAILFIVAVEKRADMANFAEFGAGKGNGCSLHGVFLHIWISLNASIEEREQPSFCGIESAARREWPTFGY
jgi:hypothetical protein